MGNRRLPKASYSESQGNGDPGIAGDFSPELVRLGDDGTDPVIEDGGFRRTEATFDTVNISSLLGNGDMFISTGLVLPLLPDDDVGDTDSSPNTNTSP